MMLKANKIIFFSLVFFFCCNAKSQINIVPNGNFENYTTCPSNSSITNCNGWLNFGFSPDYYNGCAPVGINVPHAQMGYQYAHSGIGMAGLAGWYNPMTSPNSHEFIGTQLSSPLVIGQKYFMSFFINSSGYLYNWRQLTCNKLGLRFSTVASNTLNPAPINNFAHLYTNTIYKDTVNWLKIYGSFVADSSYKYVCIGNFFTDANTDTFSYGGPQFSGMTENKG
jgi:hypothetical protein